MFQTIFTARCASVLILLAGLAAAMMLPQGALAQARGLMLGECAHAAQGYFRDYEARTDMQYNGQRTDGTHAINGNIYLETRMESFACSYAPDGNRMIEFFAEGRVQNAYLPGHARDQGSSGGGSGGSDVVRVTGISSSDLLNVRAGPGTNYRVVGKLANGDRVRSLNCQQQGNSRWCEIEMMTDMRERGWVNARYLTQGSASAPANRPVAGAGETRTVRVRFPSGSSGTELRDILAPGASIRYVLGARNGQNLYVRVAGAGGLSYQIFNPNGTFLLDQIGIGGEYRGQLWQSGDHVIEIINRTGSTEVFNAIIGID